MIMRHQTGTLAETGSQPVCVCCCLPACTRHVCPPVPPCLFYRSSSSYHHIIMIGSMHPRSRRDAAARRRTTTANKDINAAIKDVFLGVVALINDSQFANYVLNWVLAHEE
eukprot:GHVU01226477.1.p1 GENE.GHVU01226477.1~~GHVU01226477.1.p1  ORF type:complete len:111 (+),score=9.85 GHVU01226477.1:146-478(+)